MKKQLILCIAALAMTSASLAEGVYLRGNVGKNFNNSDAFKLDGQQYSFKKQNKEIMYGAAIGFQVTPEIAAEIDLRSRNNFLKNEVTHKEMRLKTRSAMINGVYQIDLGEVKPYAKAGIGMAHHDDAGETSRKFAWAAGAGVNYYVTKQLALNLDYQYFNGGDVERNGKKFDANNHEVSLGVRFDF